MTNTETSPNMLNEALAYLQRGWPVIPIRLWQKDGKCQKQPLIKWEAYQDRLPTEDEVRGWWKKRPNAGIALVTGKISGVVVIDVEKDGPTAGLTPTVLSKTGGGGFHYFYKRPAVPVKNSVKEIAPLTDVRSDGGLIVLAPSLHGSGKRYEWVMPPDMAEFEELPKWILEKSRVAPEQKQQVNWGEFSSSTVPEGGRNASAAKYIGKILRDLSSDLWPTAGWTAVKEWNAQCCKPPLNEKELRATFKSIADRETRRREKNDEKSDTVAAQLVKYITDDPTSLLFHDEIGTPYVRLSVENRRETWSCTSTQCKRWLTKKYYDTTERPVSGGPVDTAIEVISGKAFYDGPEHPLRARIARAGDAIWYDLCDKDWRAVRITANGWSVENNPPTVFRRYSHQAAQVEPVEGGNVVDLLRFVNVRDPEQQILFLVCVVAFFIPNFPHPIPYIYGPQGSAKSTFSKIVRKMADPSRIEVVSMPKNEEQLTQMLAHHYLLFFDNVSGIPNASSDLLCRAVTGSGFSKRQLYTDDEDVIYTLLANVGINGIELAPSQPDLLERSVLFELERIAKKDRRQVREIEIEFEKELPRLLGAVFTAVSRALVLHPTVQVEELPRMADFTQWGCAIAESIGYTQKEFLDAYLRNIGQQNDAVIGEHIEASIIIDFMADKDEWTGSSSELLGILKETDPANAIELPKQANVFSRKLFALKTNFEEAGLQLNRSKGSKRIITIRKRGAAPKDAEGLFNSTESAMGATELPEMPPTQDDTDDISF